MPNHNTLSVYDEFPLRLDYDDNAFDVVVKINKLLIKHGLELEMDGKEHDGFLLYRLTHRQPPSVTC